MEGNLIKLFSDLSDPRVERTKLHKLIDIVTIAICAVICGADSWEDIEEFGSSKQEWFESFLELENGIPSHDTFGRVFARLNPEEFQSRFLRWVETIRQKIDKEIVAVDGKTLRRSFNRAFGKGPIHLVSAWGVKNRLVLGQVKVDEKSNEITAIPELLRLLELSGCIVTIDAMGCQKDIVEVIVEQNADYVIALKGNQGTLHKDVELFFETAKKTKFKGIEHSFHKTIDGDHGRIEERKYWTVSDIAWLDPEKQWKGLTSIGMVEATRTIGATSTTETRYYISSLLSDAKLFGAAVRNHWGIENSLHWVLDIAFREDESRIRKDNAPTNFAILRHIALNLLKREASLKRGIKGKRLKAGWDEAYLSKVLCG